MRTFNDWRRVADRGREMVVFPYRGSVVELVSSAGTRDTLHVFKDGKFYFVLNVNKHLPYVGLEVFELTPTPGRGLITLHPEADCFFQEWRADEAIGIGWERLTPITVAKRLQDYI